MGCRAYFLRGSLAAAFQLLAQFGQALGQQSQPTPASQPALDNALRPVGAMSVAGSAMSSGKPALRLKERPFKGSATAASTSTPQGCLAFRREGQRDWSLYQNS